MRRGEVWWARLPAPAGRRPVLLLSRDKACAIRTSVTVAVITRRVRNIPTEVPLGPSDGLPQACVVNLDDILTIRKSLLEERLTLLGEEKMRLVAQAVSFALDLEEAD